MSKLFFGLSVFVIICLLLSGCNSVPIGGYKSVNTYGDTLLFYIAQKDYKSESLNNKLLVILQGSGRESITNRFGYSAKGLDMGYDVLFIEKFAFDDSVKFETTNCRERRTYDVNFVLNYINKNIYKNKIKDIVIFADSEGGEIAPEIACENNLVKRLIILGNGGLSGPEKIKILLEKEKKMNYHGFLTSSGIKSLSDIDSLLNDIKNNANSDKRFLGYTYKYWYSYIFYDVDSFYNKLSIPTLVIIGEKDMNVPCESVSFLKEKFKNKSNFYCHIIPDLNHNFIDSKGNKQFRKVLNDIVIPWFEKTTK